MLNFTLILALCVFLAAAILTRQLITWAARRGIVDTPNARSSHSHPTPRGGGLAILAAVGGGLALSGLIGLTPWSPVSIYFIGLVPVGLVSWIDDLGEVPSPIRLAVQLLAAALVVLSTGAWSQIILPPSFAIPLYGLGLPLTLFWLVGMINIYNFMDGIDGLAGLQGLLAACAWVIAGVLWDLDFAILLGSLLAAACLGFLLFNWQPAKIFMGDIGSASLGYSFAFLAVYYAAREPRVVWFGVIVLFMFCYDSSLTLLIRVSRRENIFSPHKTHLYQKLTQYGWSHSRTTVLYGMLALANNIAALLWIADLRPAGLVLVAPAMTVVFLTLVVGAQKKET